MPLKWELREQPDGKFSLVTEDKPDESVVILLREDETVGRLIELMQEEEGDGR